MRKKNRLRTGRVVAGLFLLVVCGACLLAAVSSFAACSAGQPSSPQPSDTGISFADGNSPDIVYRVLQKPDNDVHTGSLILVNNEIPFRGSTGDAVRIYEHKNSTYYVKDKNVTVCPALMNPLNRMFADFYKVTGTDDVMMISGIRSIEYQRQLYQDELAETGLSTSRLVAKPGHSEHHTGYALDFGLRQPGRKYDGSGVYHWLNENCTQYGFIVRYPPEKADRTFIDGEPWHFRYVGKPHAELMQAKGFCLEEYIDFLREYPNDGPHLSVRASDGARYEIYYVRASGGTNQVPVPSNYPYQFSGNNVDGFLVTVEL